MVPRIKDNDNGEFTEAGGDKSKGRIGSLESDDEADVKAEASGKAADQSLTERAWDGSEVAAAKGPSDRYTACIFSVRPVSSLTPIGVRSGTVLLSRKVLDPSLMSIVAT